MFCSFQENAYESYIFAVINSFLIAFILFPWIYMCPIYTYGALRSGKFGDTNTGFYFMCIVTEYAVNL